MSGPLEPDWADPLRPVRQKIDVLPPGVDPLATGEHAAFPSVTIAFYGFHHSDPPNTETDVVPMVFRRADLDFFSRSLQNVLNEMENEPAITSQVIDAFFVVAEPEPDGTFAGAPIISLRLELKGGGLLNLKFNGLAAAEGFANDILKEVEKSRYSQP